MGGDLPVLLAVCAVAPWPVDNGYALRVFNQLQQLSSQWQIKLLAPAPPAGAEPFPPGIVEYIELDKGSAGMFYPWRFDQTALQATVSATVARYAPDRALVWRGAEGAWFGPGPRPPAVADLIDCTSLLLWRGRPSRPSLRTRIGLTKEFVVASWFARRTVRRFQSVVCAGETDAEWLNKMGARGRVHVVSNGVTVPPASEVPAARSTPRDGPAPRRLIFVGSLDFSPNIDAIALLLREVWPRVRAACPDAELLIVGRNPDAAMLAHDGHDGVSVHPNVPDVFPLLRRCLVSVTPMLSGAGVKNKVLESWAVGIPAVLTPLAVNGLLLPPGHERLVDASPAGLAAAIVALFHDPAESRRLGAAARAHVQVHYTWRTTADQLDRLLRDAAPDHLGQAAARLAHDVDPAAEPHSTRLSALPSAPILRGIAYPALPDPPGPPTLYVVVDTEAEFNWSSPFERRHSSVHAMAAVERGQAVLDRHGIRPVYVVDYPVASQPEGYEPLRAILARRGCLIGAHLHPWTNPPFEEEVSTFNSFAGNLPREVESRKLDTLLAAIEQSFDLSPRFFKAGRYGVGPNTMELIAARGIGVDFSIIPARDFRRQGGPDFRDFDCRTRTLLDGRIVSVPMSRGPIGRLSPILEGLVRQTEHPAMQRMRLPGLLARFGLLEVVTLTPEGTPADKQCALIRALIARGRRTFVLHYHSPSLAAGFTPYARTPREAETIVERLETVVRFFMTEAGGVPGQPETLLPRG